MKSILLCFLQILISITCSNAHSCPSWTVQGLNEDVCYMFTKKARIFDKAEKLCVSYGGHLASITDAFTNKFIYTEALKAFAPDKLDVFWLGGITWDGVDWTWTDGTPFSYTNWDGEPFADGGTCIEQQLSNGKWTTNICDNVEQYYVCALPPNVTTTTRMTTTAPLCNGNKCAAFCLEGDEGAFCCEQYCCCYSGTICHCHCADGTNTCDNMNTNSSCTNGCT